MQNKKHLFCGLLVIGLLWACGNNEAQRNDPNAADAIGNLFTAKCAMCHSFNEDKIGPGLAGVHTRWGGDQEKLKSFIKNSKAVIDGGDPYAVALYNKWNKSEMPTFIDLSEKELNDLVAYLK